MFVGLQRSSSIADEPQNLEEVLGDIEKLGEDRESVSFGDALDAFGRRSFAPLLILFPIVEISPVGGIPGVPTALAVIIAFVALQLLVGRDHVWLPDFVERRQTDGKKLAKAVHKLDKVAAWIDSKLTDRFDFMVEGIGARVAAIGILLLCLSVPPLEFLPFASTVPMIAIAAIGLALLVRDGLLMIVALLLGGGSMIFALTSLAGSG